jgi:hypothetical protein
LVKTVVETANGALHSFAKVGATNIGKTIKNLDDNSKQVESMLPKGFMDKVKKAVPQGTKVSDFNGKTLETDLKNVNDPMALAKKMKIDTKMFDSYGK